MRRIWMITAGASALFGMWGLAMTARLMAEPILGGDSITAQSQTRTQGTEIADALALFKVQDFNGALGLLQETARKNTDLPPAQVMMAHLYLQANMPQEAKNALEQATIDAPSDPEPYLLQASLAMHEGGEAEALFQKAKSLLPTFDKSVKRKESLQWQIFSGLASVAETRKDWAGAQEILNELLKLDPKNAAAMQRVAFCLFQQENPDGALEKLRQAAKADARSLTPEFNLAQFYEQSGDHENARKWMAAAVIAAPKDIKTHLAVAEWFLQAGQFDDAQKHVREASQIDPNSLEVKLLQGTIALFQKEYDVAEMVSRSAIEHSPQNFLAINNLVLALIEQRDESKRQSALKYAETNLQQFPDSSDAAATYGWVLYKLGRLDDAEKTLQPLTSKTNLDPDAAYIVACVLAARGRVLLEGALKSTTPFLFRQEAEELLRGSHKE